MIVFLSTADTDRLTLQHVLATRGGYPVVVAANPAAPGAVEAAIEALGRPARGAAVTVLRLHGGRRACPAAAEAIVAACRERSIPLIALSGEGLADEQLAAWCTVPEEVWRRVDSYLRHGGVANVKALLHYLGHTFLGAPGEAPPPLAQPEEGIYHPDLAGGWAPSTAAYLAGRDTGRPRIGVLFYRAHWLSGNVAFVDALIRALERQGAEALPVFCQSLRAADTASNSHLLERFFLDPARGRPLVEAVISTLSFAAARLTTPVRGGLEQASEASGPVEAWLRRLDVPLLQALLCTEPRQVWEGRAAGLGPLDVAMQVALPEVDGRVIGVPISFKRFPHTPRPPLLEGEGERVVTGAALPPPRLGEGQHGLYLADEERCEAMARQAVGWAALRRTPPEARRVAIILGNYPSRRSRVGNAVGLDTPASLLALLQAMRQAGYTVEGVPHTGDELIHRLIEAGAGDESGDEDRPAPGSYDGIGAAAVAQGGLRLGNVFVGVQPARGWSDDPEAIYHDPLRPPPERYVAFYRWLGSPPPQGFGAHAVVHLGKHGTLEWLPGKAVGLSAACAPDALLGHLPLLYPFVVNDPGEGTQAKRRAHAVLIGHLVPPLATAGLYGELAELERLMAQEREARVLDPGKVPLLRQRILEAVRAAALEEELQLDGGPVAFERLVARLEGYLDELQQATIRDGLHVLGCPPRGEQRTHLLQAMLRAAPAADVPALSVALEPLLDRTADELAHLLTGLRGGFVPPGPSGSPTRGMWNVLPTGRNFYSVDPQAIPSRTSWEVGWRLAVALLERHRLEAGTYPQTVGLVVWGTAVMRTHGDDVAQALALLGVRPVWQPQSGRVSGLEVIPLAELGRPRIDVTLHLSGFFRDAFPHLVELLDDAVTMVAALDEPEGENYVAAHVRRAAAELQAAGIEGDEARRRASYRLFGSKPGCYGAGLLPLIDEQHWRTTADLARAYETWSAYAYGRGVAGRLDRQAFRARFGAIEAAVKNQDNREHDLFDSDDYFQYHGGMIATARAIRGDGGGPRAYFGDSADPRRPVVRDLAQEARRVFRSRVVNPRWLAAMRRHGYKGAFEMAATVDYLFGYDATTGVIADWMYERLAAAYILDREQQAFVARSNPWALRDMAERLLEAAARGLWQAPAPETLHHLRRVYLEADGRLEAAEAPAAGVGR